MKDEEIITKLAKKYDCIYSPNVAASENFDEDAHANTTDVTVWKDLVEDGKIQLSTGSLIRNITLNFCQPFAIGDTGAMLDILRDGLIQKSAKFVRDYIGDLAKENIIRTTTQEPTYTAQYYKEDANVIIVSWQLSINSDLSHCYEN
jgi:hypothetical protein